MSTASPAFGKGPNGRLRLDVNFDTKFIVAVPADSDFERRNEKFVDAMYDGLGMTIHVEKGKVQFRIPFGMRGKALEKVLGKLARIMDQFGIAEQPHIEIPKELIDPQPQKRNGNKLKGKTARETVANPDSTAQAAANLLAEESNSDLDLVKERVNRLLKEMGVLNIYLVGDDDGQLVANGEYFSNNWWYRSGPYIDEDWEVRGKAERSIPVEEAEEMFALFTDKIQLQDLGEAAMRWVRKPSRHPFKKNPQALSAMEATLQRAIAKAEKMGEGKQRDRMRDFLLDKLIAIHKLMGKSFTQPKTDSKHRVKNPKAQRIVIHINRLLESLGIFSLFASKYSRGAVTWKTRTPGEIASGSKSLHSGLIVKKEEAERLFESHIIGARLDNLVAISKARGENDGSAKTTWEIGGKAIALGDKILVSMGAVPYASFLYEFYILGWNKKEKKLRVTSLSEKDVEGFEINNRDAFSIDWLPKRLTQLEVRNDSTPIEKLRRSAREVNALLRREFHRFETKDERDRRQKRFQIMMDNLKQLIKAKGAGQMTLPFSESQPGQQSKPTLKSAQGAKLILEFIEFEKAELDDSTVERYLNKLHKEAKKLKKKLKSDQYKEFQYMDKKLVELYNGELAKRPKAKLKVSKAKLNRLKSLADLLGGSSALDGVPETLDAVLLPEPVSHPSFGQKDFIIPPPKIQGALKPMSFQSDQTPAESVETYQFTGRWAKLWGRPTVGFSAMIYGAAKSGKSTWTLDFCGYLARNFGTVLYASIEEGLRGTIEERIERLGVGHPDLIIKNHLPADLSAFDFVVVDSVSRGYLDIETLRALIENWPRTSFLFIFHVTKDGLPRGKNEYRHEVDVLVEIADGVAKAHGRFGNGEMEVRFG